MILLGDSKELTKQVESESVDLLFSDPIYENVDDYHWLGQQAFRVLKNDRPLLVWCSQKKVDVCKEAIKQAGFEWTYNLNYVVMGKPTRLNAYHLFTWLTPCLWFCKGKFRPDPWVVDTFISRRVDRQAGYGSHKWSKGMEVSTSWINSFSNEGDLVFDPFCGSGTNLIAARKLNRRYLGFEKDEKTYAYAQSRLSETEIQIFDYHIAPQSLF